MSDPLPIQPVSARQNLRLAVVVRGAVQGVGFRPFIYRLASALKLQGWVSNSPQGVFIEAEGNREDLEAFLLRIEREQPPRSHIQSLEYSYLDPAGHRSFEIRPSRTEGEASAVVLPDVATCPECLSEILDPSNRRFRYPFTNCTNCGPRFSIIEELPYDRPHTSMKRFPMCPDCRREYDDPADRRFHAQPNACPVCGPHLELWDPAGKTQSTHHDALLHAAEEIRSGRIVALKGLGGFHLIADARNPGAVQRLRERKQREQKPFALMFPALDPIRQVCFVTPLEERLLLSAESPIVLLRRRRDSPSDLLSDEIAPGNPCLGIMLPSTPLHHLLMLELAFPVVATSGNRSEEPICTDEREALERLEGIADVFLVHDRPIVRHVDDSVVRVLLERELVLRRARGYAPLPFRIAERELPPVLAVGAHLKNSVGVAVGRDVVMSQHIGDLETLESLTAFRRVISDLEGLYRTKPGAVVCDLHPDYLSTRHAQTLGRDVHGVQHHYAHVASCMAENRITGEVLGVPWDGTGYGTDGTIWGGEFLVTTHHSFERMGTLRPFRLPGGEQAIREPCRTALGLLAEALGPSFIDRDDLPPLKQFTHAERSILHRMLSQGLHAPVTTSAGRLFDGVASILGIRQKVRYEGQAAMELEFAAGTTNRSGCYPIERRTETRGSQPLRVYDWVPMVLSILDDLRSGVSVAAIARTFHDTLIELVLLAAREAGRERVVLSGGCFQNAVLLEGCVHRLKEEGFRPYWHQRIPPNDGGIALGQIAAYAVRHSNASTRQPEEIQRKS